MPCRSIPAQSFPTTPKGVKCLYCITSLRRTANLRQSLILSLMRNTTVATIEANSASRYCVLLWLCGGAIVWQHTVHLSVAVMGRGLSDMRVQMFNIFIHSRLPGRQSGPCLLSRCAVMSDQHRPCSVFSHTKKWNMANFIGPFHSKVIHNQSIHGNRTPLKSTERVQAGAVPSATLVISGCFVQEMIHRCTGQSVNSRAI